MICEKCKTQIPEDSKFCKECGIRLTPAPMAAPVPVRSPATIRPPSQVPSAAPVIAPPPAKDPKQTAAPAANSIPLHGTATELSFNEIKPCPTILKFKLVFKIVSGPMAGKKYSIDEPAVINIGRGTDCIIKITKEMDPAVSRHHCRLDINPPKGELTDLGSSNGTYINELRLISDKKYELKTGDTFKVGENVFSVEIKPMKDDADPAPK